MTHRQRQQQHRRPRAHTGVPEHRQQVPVGDPPRHRAADHPPAAVDTHRKQPLHRVAIARARGPVDHHRRGDVDQQHHHPVEHLRPHRDAGDGKPREQHHAQHHRAGPDDQDAAHADPADQPAEGEHRDQLEHHAAGRDWAGPLLVDARLGYEVDGVKRVKRRGRHVRQKDRHAEDQQPRLEQLPGRGKGGQARARAFEPAVLGVGRVAVFDDVVPRAGQVKRVTHADHAQGCAHHDHRDQRPAGVEQEKQQQARHHKSQRAKHARPVVALRRFGGPDGAVVLLRLDREKQPVLQRGHARVHQPEQPVHHQRPDKLAAAHQPQQAQGRAAKRDREQETLLELHIRQQREQHRRDQDTQPGDSKDVADLRA